MQNKPYRQRIYEVGRLNDSNLYHQFIPSQMIRFILENGKIRRHLTQYQKMI